MRKLVSENFYTLPKQFPVVKTFREHRNFSFSNIIQILYIVYNVQSMKNFTTPKKSSMSHNEGKGGSDEWSFVGADQLVSMMKVHKKIFVFRDTMDLAPMNSSSTLHEVLHIYELILLSMKLKN